MSAKRQVSCFTFSGNLSFASLFVVVGSPVVDSPVVIAVVVVIVFLFLLCHCLWLSLDSGPETQEVLTVVAGGVMMSGLGVVAALLLNSHRRRSG